MKAAFSHFRPSSRQNQSYVTTDGQSASLSWCEASFLAETRFLVTVRHLRVCWYLSFIIVAGPRQRSHFRIRVPRYSWPRFETPPTWTARSSYLYPPGGGWLNFPPRHWVPFSSPPTTLRTTMEVFEPASTRASIKFGVRVRVSLRLAVYRQSVPLGAKPLEVHDQRLFQPNSYGNSPRAISSLTRR
jgi:hypothetical protein